jgi:hypothetical protein
MRKELIVLFFIVFIPGICFAKDISSTSNASRSANSTQASSNAVTSTLANIFTGRVDSVLTGGGIGETKPQITVEDDKGQSMTFKIKGNIAIIDKDGKPTTLSWIEKDDDVNIAYITNPDGSISIKSIKLLSAW